jgi:hypothetical protein
MRSQCVFNKINSAGAGPMRADIFLIALTLSVSSVFAQTQDAFENKNADSSSNKGFWDPSRLSISRSMSFGMANTAGASSMQSASFYSTGLQYKFVTPVTVNLNFALPIHSSFSKYQNFSTDNMQSLEYFKNMPFDVSVSWEPTKNFHFILSVVKAAGDSYYGSAVDPMRISPFNTRW